MHPVITRRALLGLPLLALPALLLGAPRAAADWPRRVNHAEGLALRGFDPTAWHLEGRPRRGSASFAAMHDGVAWHFVSAGARERFAADPAAFAPRFGGFCAFGVAEGYKVDIDPEAWQIVEGRLYLNFNRGVNRRWARDIPGNIARAEANWPRLADA
jgi:hypothetical protein